MTRDEQRLLKEQKEKEFIEKEEEYTSECFDINSDYYNQMIAILNNAKNRELTKEVGYEIHHKIPKSYFKKKKYIIIDKNNLYKLTYSEHFLVHYYAYKCSTKFMKSSMAFALLQMKRICTKSEGVSDNDMINMSNLFENIKTELMIEKSKYLKDKSFSHWNKLTKDKSENFILSNRISSKDNIWNIKCNNCGIIFSRSLTKFLKIKLICPNCSYQEFNIEHKKSIVYDNTYMEDVDVLWFGIDESKKSVWGISKVSYTPSMKKSNTRLSRYSYECNRTLNIEKKHLLKISIIDVKPKNYDWNLPLNKKYKKQTSYEFKISDLENQLVQYFWNKKDVSDLFIYKVCHKPVKTYKKYLNLSERDKLCIRKYYVNYSEECKTIEEWENIYNRTWSSICKNNTVHKEFRTDELLLELYNLERKYPNILNVICFAINYIIDNNLSEDNIIDIINKIYENLRNEY